MERDSALDLPVAAAKARIKTSVPASASLQQLPSSKIVQATSHPGTVEGQLLRKKESREAIGLRAGQAKNVAPALESERRSVPHDRCMKVEDLHGKLLRFHAQTLEPHDQDAERQPLTKEKQRKLVEQSKRLWHRKEKDLQESQLNEQ